MASDDGPRAALGPFSVVDIDMGDDRPDSSGEPSDRSLKCASRRPVALALEDPMAGAAFWPSVPT